MKILMTADTVGGVWTYAMELTRALAQHDVEVVLAAMGREPTRAQREEAAGCGAVDVQFSDYQLEWMHDPWRDVEAAGHWLRDIARDAKPDVIHLNNYGQADAIKRCMHKTPLIVAAHSCVLSWWRAVRGEEAPADWDTYRECVMQGLRAADLVVAPTRAMMKSAAADYGPLRAQRVIPNGRSAPELHPDRKRELIFSAGRMWDEAKNLAALKAIAAQTRWPISIAGPTDTTGGPSETANLALLGQLPMQEVAAHMRSASIYALPARYEPFGLSVLEAAMAGCALVLGDIPSLRENWEGAAAFVDPNDHDALRETIDRLIEKSEQRAVLAEAAVARARRFTAERMARQYVRAYQELAPTKTRRVSSSGRMLVGTGNGTQVSRERNGAASQNGPHHTLTQNPSEGLSIDAAHGRRLRVVLFYHSLLSDWNHGNAHFLRGVVSELLERGHEVRVYEPADGWSLQNLRKRVGEEAIDEFRQAFPHLRSTLYRLPRLDLDEALDGADLVIAHEWNEPRLIARLSRHRIQSQSSYRLLFHDTHHRSVSQPVSMAKYDLTGFDGVLAFGSVIRDIYLDRGWCERAWTWHEAADVRTYRPQPTAAARKLGDVVWIGNWGDEERTAELREFLIEPIRRMDLRAKMFGVRYPATAVRLLHWAGIEYGGYLPAAHVPRTFSAYRATIHVPRRHYTRRLPGIPTIRVFEALACGIPLICSPWEDAEGLFAPGEDYLVARDGSEMKRLLRDVLRDEEMARALAQRGRETVLAAHTCAHRVDELLRIYAELRPDTAAQPHQREEILTHA